MKFVKLQGDNQWYLWEEERMFLSNIRRGGMKIDENDPKWMNAEIREFDSWMDMSKNTGFRPIAHFVEHMLFKRIELLFICMTKNLISLEWNRLKIF